MTDRPPNFHVCITCRAGLPLLEGQTAPGQIFHDHLAAVAGPDAAVTIVPVTCLSLCQQGCAAAISQPGKWSYLLGGLTTEMAADLLTYGALYAASKTGAVMPSKRPPALADMVRARLPAPELL